VRGGRQLGSRHTLAVDEGVEALASVVSTELIESDDLGFGHGVAR